MKNACERCGRVLEGPRFACTHECTYCEACARELSWRCPNCGGVLAEVR